MSEEQAKYDTLKFTHKAKRKSPCSELDSIKFHLNVDRIDHCIVMMRWNVTRKETDIQMRVTGIRAWISEVKENLKSIEDLLDQHGK